MEEKKKSILILFLKKLLSLSRFLYRIVTVTQINYDYNHIINFDGVNSLNT